MNTARHLPLPTALLLLLMAPATSAVPRGCATTTAFIDQDHVVRFKTQSTDTACNKNCSVEILHLRVCTPPAQDCVQPSPTSNRWAFSHFRKTKGWILWTHCDAGGAKWNGTKLCDGRLYSGKQYCRCTSGCTNGNKWAGVAAGVVKSDQLNTMLSAVEKQHARVLNLKNLIPMSCPTTFALFNNNDTLVYKTATKQPDECKPGEKDGEMHFCTTVFGNFSGVYGDGLTAEQAELVGRLGDGRFVKQSCDRRSTVFLQNRAQLSAAGSVGYFCQHLHDSNAVGGLEPASARVVCVCHENCESGPIVTTRKLLDAHDRAPQYHINEFIKMFQEQVQSKKEAVMHEELVPTTTTEPVTEDVGEGDDTTTDGGGRLQPRLWLAIVVLSALRYALSQSQ